MRVAGPESGGYQLEKPVEETVLVEPAVAPHVARITLNRPDHANTLTYAAMTGYLDALEQAHASGATVLVVSGAGADLTVGRDKGERVPGVTRADNLRLILRAVSTRSSAAFGVTWR